MQAQSNSGRRRIPGVMWGYLKPQLITAVGIVLSPVIAAIVVLYWTDPAKEELLQSQQRQNVAMEIWFRIQNYEQRRLAELESRPAEWPIGSRMAMDGVRNDVGVSNSEYVGQTLVTLLWKLAVFTGDNPDDGVDVVTIQSHMEDFLVPARDEKDELAEKVNSLRSTIQKILPNVISLSGKSTETGRPSDTNDRSAQKAPPKVGVQDMNWRNLREFMLWQSLVLLACIGAVALLVVLVRYYRDFRILQQQRQDKTRKLALEIEFRTQAYWKVKETGKEIGPEVARKALDGTIDRPISSSEFRELPLISLLWELLHVCDQDKSKTLLTTMISRLPVTPSLTIEDNFPQRELDELLKNVSEAVALSGR